MSTDNEHGAAAAGAVDRPVPALGPCAVMWCFAPGVAYVFATVGASARITVVTGPRAAVLGATTPEGFLGVRCAEHVLHDVQAVIEGGPR